MKLIKWVIGFLAVSLVLTGCTSILGVTTEEKASTLESTYKVAKKGVQYFVPEKTRENYNTKSIDKVITGGYEIIKNHNLKKDK